MKAKSYYFFSFLITFDNRIKDQVLFLYFRFLKEAYALSFL